MLLDAKNYDALFQDKNKLGGKGLSPEVAAYVIEKAEAVGLPVYAHIDLIDRCQSQGLTIALGSDQYNKTLGVEIDYLHTHDIMDPLSILRAITHTNPQLIFPERKIGAIRPGFEGSFLVLTGNPREDLDYLKRVGARYVQGKLIEP